MTRAPQMAAFDFSFMTVPSFLTARLCRQRGAQGRLDLWRKRERGQSVVRSVRVGEARVVDDHAEARGTDLEVAAAVARVDGRRVIPGRRPHGPVAVVAGELHRRPCPGW